MTQLEPKDEGIQMIMVKGKEPSYMERQREGMADWPRTSGLGIELERETEEVVCMWTIRHAWTRVNATHTLIYMNVHAHVHGQIYMYIC